MADRKASTAILEMEIKLNRLAGLVQNTDNNVKLILDRLNRITELLNKQPIINIPKTIQQVPEQSVPEQPSESFLRRTAALQKLRERAQQPEEEVTHPAMKAEPKTYDDFGIDDEGNRELEESVVPTGRRRDQRIPPAPQKTGKLPVSQQLLFPDGKPLFLANIEIFDDKGLLIKQTKTNAKGRWIAPLISGYYTIQVHKKNSQDKKQVINMRYQIEVPPGDGQPLELPSPEIV